MRPPPRAKNLLDVPTIVAFGVVSSVLMLVVHEILGHSLTTVALGAQLVHVSSIDSSYRGPASPGTMRAIAAAGIVANILVGCIVLGAARFVAESRFETQYFAWLFGHATLFMGSGYLAAFAFLPGGDVHLAIAGLPLHFGLQTVLFLLGIAIYRATLIDAGRTLARWVAPQDRARLTTLTLVPYLAMGIPNTLAACFNPVGPAYGALWAAAATFGSTIGFLFAAPAAENDSANAVPFQLTRSWAWIAAGAIATLLLFVVLGPGVPHLG